MQQARYSPVARALHWLIAILVIVNWRIVEATEGLPRAERIEIMGKHMALGIVILVLVLLRLGWRLAHKPPELSAALKPWERVLAKTVHAIFYVLLIGMPLAGWLASSFIGRGVDIFGLFTLPALPVAANPDIGKEIFEIHGTFGTILLILIAVHVLGSLKHTFIDKDGNLFRMLPWGTPKA
jgi:cytochrome b561